MKKFILPSIFAFSALFGCNNDDDSSIDNASIVGTWSFVKYQTQYSKDNRIEDQYLANECDSKNTYSFSKDNKYSAIGYDLVNGKCDVDWNENGTYTISGNKLRLDYGKSDFQEAEITKLTKNELVIKADYGEDLDKDGKNEIDILVLKR